MNFLLLLTVFSTIVSANDCVTCSKELKPFSAVEKNIESLQAPTIIDCNETLKNNAKEEYLILFSKLPKKQEKIGGLSLLGSADELKYLKKMLGDKPTNRWSTARDCKTVLCAITKIYNSEETAQRVLNIAQRDGYIVSAAKDFDMKDGPIGQLFSPEEIRDIDLSYKMLPPTYKKLSSMNRLKRMPDGYSSPRAPNAAAYASPGYHSMLYDLEGEITFLDKGFSNNKSWGPMVAVHELSHHVDFSNSKKTPYGISESPEYLQLSGWKKKTTYQTDKKTGKKTENIQWEHRTGKKFITDYASTKPVEDFAESAAHYVFHPKELQAIDPEKYNYLKENVFKGKEYKSQIELPFSEKEILRICIDSEKKYSLYGSGKYFSSPISSSCIEGISKDFKISDPALCSFNPAQINNMIKDSISPSVSYLNETLKNCDNSLPANDQECMEEKNYQKDCAIKKHFDKTPLSSTQVNLSEEETKQLQVRLVAKIRYEELGNRNKKVMDSIVSNLGKNNFISEMLINGLSEKGKIHEQYSLTMQSGFLKNANVGLTKKLKQEGYKFDDGNNFDYMTQSYLIKEKDMEESFNNFQENVLKKATKSKEKNLELIKTWAKSQSLDETPSFETLAETLRKYGSFTIGRK